MTATLVLGEDVDVCLELGVWGDRAWLDNNLTALNVFTLETAEQQTTVLASPCFVELLVEHLDTGNGGLLQWAQTNDLNLGVELEGTALCTAGNNGTATGNGEDVLDWHQEWLILLADWVWDVLVNSVHELHDGVSPLLVALESLVSGNADNWCVVAVEALGGQKFANFHLDEVEELFVVNHVALVECNEQCRNANLAGQQNVLAGLSHWAVSSSNHEDCAVHLSSTGNHVLDVVSVAWSVNVCVVTLLGLVLHVGDGDGNTALALFRSGVNGVEVALDVGLRWETVSQYLRDSSGERRLTVVNVADGANVYVRLGAVKLCLCHRFLLELFSANLLLLTLLVSMLTISLLMACWFMKIQRDPVRSPSP